MEQVLPDVDRVAAHLVEEIEQCHTQILDLHWCSTHNGYSTRLECAKLIARLMQSQASAMVALKRLRSDGTQHTCTVVHQGVPPTPKISKTNVPAAGQEQCHAETTDRP
jgi:hypothetical protein